MSNTKNPAPKILNQLLAALPKKDFDKIKHSLTLVDLEMDEVLWEMDEKRKNIYFPTTAMICLLYEAEDGTSVEVGMTGCQGMVGIVTFIGDARMAKRAVVQGPGQAWVMKAKDVQTYFEEIPAFSDICMSYTQTLIAQISQSAICNRLHTIEQQICRYLLISGDNLHSTTLNMTHARIASVLGVRRESISVSAGLLQDRGLIRYGGGKLELLDRKGLLGAVCECYHVVAEQYERILGKYTAHHKH